MNQLGQATPRLLCSLVHKFGRKDRGRLRRLHQGAGIPAEPYSVGEVFVFVDECHRTQSGKLHRVMKAMMPNAVFIGFTGTPLLKKDAQTSLEVFGGYIHTYKFSEGVEDGVVLDLIYEARDIDQRLGFRRKRSTPGSRPRLQRVERLAEGRAEEASEGTMQKVLSSKSRMRTAWFSDIVFDFSVKPSPVSATAAAMPSWSRRAFTTHASISRLFQKTPLKGRCAVVTSYNPLGEGRDAGGNRR